MQGPYDFGWRLSGEAAVAPLQVFSSPKGIWLQFGSGPSRPAVFGSTPGSAPTLLSVIDMAPYAFVPGAWSRLIFQAGKKQAFATRAAPVAPVDGHYAQDQDVGSGGTFDVSRQDANIRRVLARWAAVAGWTFEAEHWTAPGDIPVSAGATLGNDFRAAVRALLAATEMGELPLQPCFYSNRVLRVIGYAQSCDPRRQGDSATLRAEARP